MATWRHSLVKGSDAPQLHLRLCLAMQIQCGMARSSDFAENSKLCYEIFQSLNVTGNSKCFQHFQQPNTAGLQATML